MKVRIVTTKSGYYVGEVYREWYNWLLGTYGSSWEAVTGKCLTSVGAMLELKLWKKRNTPKVFEI